MQRFDDLASSQFQVDPMGAPYIKYTLLYFVISFVSWTDAITATLYLFTLSWNVVVLIIYKFVGILIMLPNKILSKVKGFWTWTTF